MRIACIVCAVLAVCGSAFYAKMIRDQKTKTMGLDYAELYFY